ncbi:hypothetical protein BH23ACT12_BH23ACT12_18180 [soil metagenome]
MHVVLLLLTLFWAGLLVIRFVDPMLGGESGTLKRKVGRNVLIALGVLTVSGFVFDQWIHGRFL